MSKDILMGMLKSVSFVLTNRKNTYQGMMLRNRNSIFLICGALLAVILVCYVAYNSKTSDTRKLQTHKSFTTDTFIEKMQTTDHAYIAESIEKAIEIEGEIKEVNFKHGKYSLILTGKKQDFLILCEMQKDQENVIQLLKEQDTVIIKGVLKGFLKDAILLNCIIIDSQSHE